MLVEIVRELTNIEESKDVLSEQVLAWIKRVKAQKAQSKRMNSLNETKVFDKIKTERIGQRHIERKLPTYAKAPTKQICVYCGSSHLP